MKLISYSLIQIGLTNAIALSDIMQKDMFSFCEANQTGLLSAVLSEQCVLVKTQENIVL